MRRVRARASLGPRALPPAARALVQLLSCAVCLLPSPSGFIDAPVDRPGSVIHWWPVVMFCFRRYHLYFSNTVRLEDVQRLAKADRFEVVRNVQEAQPSQIAGTAQRRSAHHAAVTVMHSPDEMCRNKSSQPKTKPEGQPSRPSVHATFAPVCARMRSFPRYRDEC